MKYISSSHYDVSFGSSLINLEQIQAIVLEESTIFFYGNTEDFTKWEFKSTTEASKAYERIYIAVA